MHATLQSARRRSWIICLTLLSVVSFSLLTVAAQTPQSAAATPSPWPESGLPAFSLTDSEGRPFTEKTLAGKEWVVGFFFTSCRGPCPQLIAAMKRLQDETGVTLVSITVDPERDTPDVLRNYASEYVDTAKPREDGTIPEWYWVTGDQAEIFALIHKGFLMPAFNDERKIPGFEVAHSNNLLHVDENGRVLGKYLATDDAAMALLRRILQGKAPRGQMIRQENPAPPNQEAVPDEEVVGREVPGISFSRSAASDDQESPPQDDQQTVASVSENGQKERPAPPAWALQLPAVNASLNGLATILLLAGYVQIKRRKVHSHKWLMLASFGTSVVFLACYLVYHAFVLSKPSPHTGFVRILYFTILISHIILAATVPVLAPMTIYRALRKRWEAHRRLAVITFPIWLYVSVTGVVIYLMLYHWPTG